jgi:hypothetical protein
MKYGIGWKEYLDAMLRVPKPDKGKLDAVTGASPRIPKEASEDIAAICHEWLSKTAGGFSSNRGLFDLKDMQEHERRRRAAQIVPQDKIQRKPGVYLMSRNLRRAPVGTHNFVLMIPENPEAYKGYPMVDLGGGTKGIITSANGVRVDSAGVRRLYQQFNDPVDVEAAKQYFTKGDTGGRWEPTIQHLGGDDKTGLNILSMSNDYGSRPLESLKKYPWFGIGQNSNTFANTLLRRAGLAPKSTRTGAIYEGETLPESWMKPDTRAIREKEPVVPPAPGAPESFVAPEITKQASLRKEAASLSQILSDIFTGGRKQLKRVDDVRHSRYMRSAREAVPEYDIARNQMWDAIDKGKAAVATRRNILNKQNELWDDLSISRKAGDAKMEQTYERLVTARDELYDVRSSILNDPDLSASQKAMLLDRNDLKMDPIHRALDKYFNVQDKAFDARTKAYEATIRRQATLQKGYERADDLAGRYTAKADKAKARADELQPAFNKADRQASFRRHELDRIEEAIHERVFNTRTAAGLATAVTVIPGTVVGITHGDDIVEWAFGGDEEKPGKTETPKAQTAPALEKKETPKAQAAPAVKRPVETPSEEKPAPAPAPKPKEKMVRSRSGVLIPESEAADDRIDAERDKEIMAEQDRQAEGATQPPPPVKPKYKIGPYGTVGMAAGGAGLGALLTKLTVKNPTALSYLIGSGLGAGAGLGATALINKNAEEDFIKETTMNYDSDKLMGLRKRAAERVAARERVLNKEAALEAGANPAVFELTGGLGLSNEEASYLIKSAAQHIKKLAASGCARKKKYRKARENAAKLIKSNISKVAADSETMQEAERRFDAVSTDTTDPMLQDQLVKHRTKINAGIPKTIKSEHQAYQDKALALQMAQEKMKTIGPRFKQDPAAMEAAQAWNAFALSAAKSPTRQDQWYRYKQDVLPKRRAAGFTPVVEDADDAQFNENLKEYDQRRKRGVPVDEALQGLPRSREIESLIGEGIITAGIDQGGIGKTAEEKEMEEVRQLVKTATERVDRALEELVHATS